MDSSIDTFEGSGNTHDDAILGYPARVAFATSRRWPKRPTSLPGPVLATADESLAKRDSGGVDSGYGSVAGTPESKSS